MSDDTTAHRESVRAQLVHLVRDGGAGWHAYALDEAEALVKDDPILHGGLVAEVEKQIGEKATKEARRAMEWFRRHP